MKPIFLITTFWVVVTLNQGLALDGTDRSEPGMHEGFRWEGRGNWTINAGAVAASTKASPRVNKIQVFVPDGAEIEKAILYSAVSFSSPGNLLRDSPEAKPDVILDGTRFSGDQWTRVGFPPKIGGLSTPDGRAVFATHRVDVTDALLDSIGDSRGALEIGIQEIDEEDPLNEIYKLTSGEVLVIIYSHPSEAERLIILHDGYARPEESLTVDFARQIDSSVEGFEAQMSLAIANSQQSDRIPRNRNGLVEVDIDGRRLTSAAGGPDDGFKAGINGPVGTSTLITVGGRGNDTANIGDPFSLPAGRLFAERTDDELYDLAKGNELDAAPYLADGTSSLQIDIRHLNPLQLNVPFFLGLNIVTQAAPPEATSPDPEPEPDAPQDDSPVSTSYQEAFSWSGKGNWSISAIGKGGFSDAEDSSDEKLVASVPPGSTVEKAILYTAIYNHTSSNAIPFIRFNRSLINPNHWARLDPLYQNVFTERGQQIFRTDVTEQVRAVVGSGAEDPFEFSVTEYDRPGSYRVRQINEGEALVVVYSNPSETTRSIVLIDGEGPVRYWEKIAVRGDHPINRDAAGFEALLSLGIAGSWQNTVNAAGGSSVEVDISSNSLPVQRRRLTSSAGGSDDSKEARGNGTELDGQEGMRFTMGGLGDSPDNPPAKDKHGGNGRMDDELYDLANGILPPGAFEIIDARLRANHGKTAHFFFGLNLTTDVPLHFDPRAEVVLPEAGK